MEAAPVVEGGDFNDDPSTAAQVWDDVGQKGRVVATVAHTCTNSSAAGGATLDFWMVSEPVARLADTVTLCEVAGLTPHTPVVLHWNLTAGDELIEVVQRTAPGEIKAAKGDKQAEELWEQERTARWASFVMRAEEVLPKGDFTVDMREGDQEVLDAMWDEWHALLFEELHPRCGMRMRPGAPVQTVRMRLRDLIRNQGPGSPSWHLALPFLAGRCKELVRSSRRAASAEAPAGAVREWRRLQHASLRQQGRARFRGAPVEWRTLVHGVLQLLGVWAGADVGTREAAAPILEVLGEQLSKEARRQARVQEVRRRKSWRAGRWRR